MQSVYVPKPKKKRTRSAYPFNMKTVISFSINRRAAKFRTLFHFLERQ